MQISLPYHSAIRTIWRQHRPDLRLLAFLVLLVNVKLAVKGLAIAGVLLFLPAVRRSLRLRELPLFYPIAMGIALANWLLNAGFMQVTTTLPFLLALLGWMACLFASGIAKFFSEVLNAQELERTLAFFFVLNALVVFGQYAAIVWKTGAFNPYAYQGDHQKYFIGTGDYLKGLSFDTSINNAALNSLGLLYFLQHRRVLLLLTCMVVLLLAGSNLLTIACLGILLLRFAWQSDRLQRSAILVCLFLAVVFFGKISPQNGEYVNRMAAFFTGKEPVAKQAAPIERGPEARRKKAAQDYIDSVYAASRPLVPASVQPAVLTLPVADIHSAPYQHRDDTTEQRKVLISYVAAKGEAHTLNSHYASDHRPGKWIAAWQTFDYLADHPRRILLGLGAGNYSSRLAFRTTALDIAGGYPQRWKYLHPAFEADHFSLYVYFFSQRAARHSVLNGPDSVYDQLLSEYGLLGLLALAIFYFGFFYRGVRPQAFERTVLLFLLFLLATGYWFEQLSVIPLAELLLFASRNKMQDSR